MGTTIPAGRGRLLRTLGVLLVLGALAGPAARQSALATVQADDTADAELTELWTFETGDSVKPDPVVAEGVVFIPSLDGVVHAVDTATGEELWQAPHRKMAGLATASGAVFTREFDEEEERGRLVARDIADGEERWAFETEDGFASTSLTIAADEDIVLVYVARGEAPAGEPFVVLVALDLSDGTERWRLDSTAPSAYDEGIVYVSTADVNGLIALDVTSGEELWVTDDFGTLYHDGVFYDYRKSKGGLQAVDAQTGDELWLVPLDDAAEMTLFTANDGALYFTENRDDGVALLAYDLERQETRWVVSELPGGRLTGLAFDGGRAIVALAWDSPELPGGLVVLDAADGDTVARADVPEYGADSMAFADGVIYVGEWKMLRAIAFDATASSGQSDDGDAATTLDLAAMTLTPQDLEDAGLDGYGLGYSETVFPDVYAANAALNRDLPEREVHDLLDDAGFRRAYTSYLYLAADEDDPAGAADRFVFSYVLEFADAEGAEAAWSFVEDESEDDSAEDLDDVEAFGDESEATRAPGEDEATGDRYDALDLTFRLDNLHAGVTIVDWTGEEPDLDEAEALAELLLERVEQTGEGDSPGLGSRVVRLTGEAIVPSTDHYLILDGEALPLYGESRRDIRARENGAADAEQTDGYRLWQQVAAGTDAPDDDLWYGVDLMRFAGEDEAADWLADTEERIEDNAAFDNVEFDDAVEFGDESVGYTLETADGGLYYRGMSVRVGATVATIDIVGPQMPPAAAIEALAEAQAACLEDGGCLDPVALPDGLASSDEGDTDANEDDRNQDDRDDEDEDESGSTASAGGESYVSPTWDYTVRWDPETWVATGGERDDGIKLHIMGSVLTTVVIQGTESAEGDPETCLTEVLERVQGGDTPMVESEDLPAPETIDEAVAGVYELGDFSVFYFECRPLVDGEAVILVVFSAPVGEYEQALPALEELLAGIEVA